MSNFSLRSHDSGFFSSSSSSSFKKIVHISSSGCPSYPLHSHSLAKEGNENVMCASFRSMSPPPSDYSVIWNACQNASKFMSRAKETHSGICITTFCTASPAQKRPNPFSTQVPKALYSLGEISRFPPRSFAQGGAHCRESP
jgi:hypothetical protein